MRGYLDKPSKWDGLAMCLSPFFFIAIPIYLWVRLTADKEETNE